MANDEQQRYEAIFREINRVQRSGLFVCWGVTFVVAFAFGVVGGLFGPDLSATQPRWLSFLTLVLPFAVAIILTPSFAQWLMIRGRTARALETLNAFALREAQQYRAATGQAVPRLTNPAAARAWLTRGEGIGTRVRVRLQIWAGHLDEAIRSIEALPSGTPTDEFHRLLLRQLVDFVRTGGMDLTHARSILAELPPSQDRELAVAALAFEEARLNLARGGDYLQRLAEARSQLTVLPPGASIRERFIAGLPMPIMVLIAVGVLTQITQFA